MVILAKGKYEWDDLLKLKLKRKEKYLNEGINGLQEFYNGYRICIFGR